MCVCVCAGGSFGGKRVRSALFWRKGQAIQEAHVSDTCVFFSPLVVTCTCDLRILGSHPPGRRQEERGRGELMSGRRESRRHSRSRDERRHSAQQLQNKIMISKKTLIGCIESMWFWVLVT